MKVFLSWSGNRSRLVADLLSEWLRCVIQAARPWISTRDLDRGSLWFGEINDQLKDTTIGIVCLTQENKNRPWILFEAGALAKGLSTSRVCTLLVDLEPKDVEDPLAQFNHTLPQKSSMFSLVRTLNGTLGQASLDERVLEQVFATYWPQFELKFQQVLESSESIVPAKPRPKDDVLSEILDNTRVLSSRIRRLEHQMERSRDTPPDMLMSESSSYLHSEAVLEAIKAGLPIDKALEQFGGRLPISMVRRMYDAYKTDRPDIGPDYRARD